MKKSSCIKTKMVKLDPYQEIALKNIDAMKEEMVNMVRKKRDIQEERVEWWGRKLYGLIRIHNVAQRL